MSCETYPMVADDNTEYEVTWLEIRSNELDYILERREPELDE